MHEGHTNNSFPLIKLVCDATGICRNKQEFIINIYDPFMSIHEYSCSAAGRKEETNYRNTHNFVSNS